MADIRRECDYISGWIAGMGGVLVINPFDAVKTKQQHLDIGFKDGAYTIKRLEGYGGFFRGVALPLLVNGMLNAMYFTMYGEMLSLLRVLRSTGTSPSQCVSNNTDSDFFSKTVPHNIGKIADVPKKSKCKTIDCVFAGAVAGVFQMLIACPVEVIKVRQQAYGTIAGSAFTCAVNIYHVKGIKGLYRGFSPMALRNVGGGMIQSFIYKGLNDHRDARIQTGTDTPSQKFFSIWLNAGFAGMVSWWVVAPVDVIKTKIQADELTSPRYKGIISCANKIIARNGYLGLFRGVMTLSLPNFIVNGAILLIYNGTDTICRYYNYKYRG